MLLTALRFSLAAIFLASAAVHWSAAGDPADVGQPIAAPAGGVVMRLQLLVDPYPNMNAVSILVPAGWEVKNAFNWIPGAAGGPEIDIVVVNSAEKAAVRMYPDLFFTDGDREVQQRAIMHNDPSGRVWKSVEHFYDEGKQSSPGQEIRHVPQTPRDYVLKILIPKLRPALVAAKDITVVSETDLPEVANAMTVASGIPNIRFLSSRIRITYTAPAGKAEEDFVCTLRIFPRREGAFATQLWSAQATSAWAPEGKLDSLTPTLTAISSSKQLLLPYINFTVQIGQMVLQAQREQLQRMIANENERIRQYGEWQRRASAQVSLDIRDRFQKQQDVKAQVQASFMHYINGTSAYTDPHTGSSVVLPSNYRFSYVNSRGDVILNDDASYKPPLDPGSGWSPMTKGP